MVALKTKLNIGLLWSTAVVVVAEI